MRPYIIVFGALALVAGCDKAGQVSLARPAWAAVAPAAMPSPANQAAADFVAKALGDDRYEVEAAQIVAKRATSPAVRAFAETMAKDHAEAARKLKLAVAQSHEAVPIPTDLPDHLQSMLDLLARGRPQDFDKTYIEQQVQAHEEALTLVTAYGKTGAVPAIRALAADMAPTIQAHLDQARSIDDALNKAS
jgi:putative membrane protein